MAEFDKVFLEIDKVYRLDGDLFGKEWDKIRKQQIGFLLERPLMFKVLTEKVWGPARLDALTIDEWWEAEQGLRDSDRNQEIEELADMALLFLTLDSFDPSLLLPTQTTLSKMGWDDTVAGYCEDMGLDRNDLIPIAEKKIKTNRARNPKEAFMLVAEEDMQTSIKRMDNNWLMLKEKRDKTEKQLKRKDWWKKLLYVDNGGWIRETGK